MTDLHVLLVSAAGPPSTLTDTDLGRILRRSRRRRAAIVAALAGVFIVLAALAYAAAGPGMSSRSIETPITEPTVDKTDASTAPDPAANLSARLVLPTHALKAGSTLSGYVRVKNHSGAPVEVRPCHGIGFSVSLVGNGVQQETGFLGCIGPPVTIPRGTSNYPVMVVGFYTGCSMGPAAQPNLPLCGSAATLPAGAYTVKTYANFANLKVPTFSILITPA